MKYLIECLEENGNWRKFNYFEGSLHDVKRKMADVIEKTNYMERTYKTIKWVLKGIFSTDDLFMVDGEYQFDPSKLKEYHLKNLQNAGAWMKEHEGVASQAYCVIDNTNTQAWEYEKYVEVAKENGFMVQVITVDWNAQDIPLYAERNSHGVPEEAIRRMAERWE